MPEQVLIEKYVAGDLSVSLAADPISADWKDAIENELVQWGAAAQSGSNSFDFPAPTVSSVSAALKLLATLRTPSAPSVCPNGDGGVSFEWEQGESLHGIEVNHQGCVRETSFQGAALVYSQDFDASLFK